MTPETKRDRIEDKLVLPLGTVLEDQAGYRWVFIGREKTTTGFNHLFVREGNLDFNYSCSFLDTFQKKFPMILHLGVRP